MDSTSIISALEQQLGSDTVARISRQLGVDPSMASSAISMALPTILGGLAKNASHPQGAEALNNALADHDGSILDNLGGLLQNPAGSAGAAILGHIFGRKQAPLEQGLGKATGMNAQQIGQLLMMLAPIVMGVLGRMKQTQGLGAQQIPDVLNQSTAEIEQKAPETAGLSQILDRNHDGNIADDIARMGSSVFGGLFDTKS
ncbi:MAG: DUF937 domain-containing protein [Acidobacteriota bacterium]